MSTIDLIELPAANGDLKRSQLLDNFGSHAIPKCDTTGASAQGARYPDLRLLSDNSLWIIPAQRSNDPMPV
ncbi:MAG: hypothetical protein WBC93_01350 [Sulfitobacter sp.]